MFKQFDEAIATDDFVEITVFVASIPLWQLPFVYLYTFRFWKKGKEYRKCLGYIKFPYYLKYKLLMKRLRE
jgi:hypothetical protein